MMMCTPGIRLSLPQCTGAPASAFQPVLTLKKYGSDSPIRLDIISKYFVVLDPNLTVFKSFFLP